MVRDREVFIGASIGIAIGGDEADDLLRNADLALYRAKSKGKGQKQVFEPEMHVAMVERLELEESLAQALRGSELTLHYQPILELRSERLAGVEALVRWMHPTRGLLLPGRVHPDRRGQPPDAAARALGASHRLPTGRRMATAARGRPRPRP